MGSLRVWVSYAADNSQEETTLVQQLIDDLRKAGAVVATDDAVPSNEQFQTALQRELSRCQWFLLVQTQQAVRSDRVLSAMNMAMAQTKQRLLHGVLRVVCPSSDACEEPARWSETMAYPYNEDYPRLRDKILLDLDLLRLDGENEAAVQDVNNVATKWLIHDQEAGIALSPTASSVASPVVREAPVPAESLVLQSYLAGSSDRPDSWRSREKIRGPQASSSPSTLFARLRQSRSQKKMSTTGGMKIVPGDRPPPRPFLFSRRFWLYGIALLGVLVLLSVPELVFGVVERPHPPSPKPMPSPTSTTTSRPSPIPPPRPNSPVLAQDTFQRADQALWGTASDGHMWGGDANTNPAFSIANGAGQIANATGVFNAVTGPSVGNADVEVQVTANQFANDVNMMNIGVALRWNDTNDWYKVLIDGSDFSIDKAVHGQQPTIIDTMKFAARGGTTYTIRFEANGSTLQAKVWPSDQPEPPNWMLVISDATFTRGQAGVRVVMQNTTQITVLSFKETAL